jgi:uncharacterized protein (TIGR02271 family)
VPCELLEVQAEEAEELYRLPVVFSQLEAGEGAGEFALILPVVEEQVRVGKRTVEQGRVRVRKRVRERVETVEEPVMHEEVLVERVPVGRLVETPPGVHREGETIVIPVMAEVLVVQKRLMLKEEVRVTMRRREVYEEHEVTLRAEEVTIEREEDEMEGRGSS